MRSSCCAWWAPAAMFLLVRWQKEQRVIQAALCALSSRYQRSRPCRVLLHGSESLTASAHTWPLRSPLAALYETALRRVPLTEDEVDVKQKHELSLIQQMLPDELLLEILQKLPIRFATRCMAVCKQARR